MKKRLSIIYLITGFMILVDFAFLFIPCLKSFSFYEIINVDSGSPINITSIITASFTVFAFIINFPKDEIYGLSLDKVRKFLSNKYFDFKTVLIINCSILIVNALSSALGLKFTIIAVQIISVIVFLIFSIQQYKLIANKKEIARKIIRNHIIEHEYSDLMSTLSGKQLKDDLMNLIRNFTLKEGVEDLFNLLKDEKNKSEEDNLSLLDFLNKQQFEYLNIILATDKEIDEAKGANNLKLSRSELIAKGFENVLWSYSYIEKRYFESNIDSSLFTLSNNCIVLHKLSERFKLLNLEKDFYEKLLNRIHLHMEKTCFENIYDLLVEKQDNKAEEIEKINDNIKRYNPYLLEKYKGLIDSIEDNKDVKQEEIDAYKESYESLLKKKELDTNVFLTYLTLCTIKDDEDWFLDYLFLKQNELLFYDGYLQFTILMTYVVSYLINELDEKEELTIYKFINAEREPLGLFKASWGGCFVGFLQRVSMEKIFNLQNKIIELYDAVKNELLILNYGKLLNSKVVEVFNINKIFMNLFECVEVNGGQLNHSDAELLFTNLNGIHKKEFSSFLNTYLEINGKKNFDFSLKKSINALEHSHCQDRNNNELYNSLFRITNRYQFEEYTKYVENKIKNIDEVKSQLSSMLNENITKLSFYDKSLDTSVKTIDFEQVISAKKSVNFFDCIINKFNELVIEQLENEINKYEKSIETIEDKAFISYSNKTISTLKNMKVSYASKIDRIPQSEINIDVDELFKKDYKINFLFSKYAIRFCANIDEDCITILEPDEEFLKKFIDDNYSGEEKEFYLYPAENDFVFYVDKNGLFEMIKKEYCIVKITFKYIF